MPCLTEILAVSFLQEVSSILTVTLLPAVSSFLRQLAETEGGERETYVFYFKDP